MRKTGRYLPAAVDSRKLDVLIVTAEFESLFNNRSEILILADMRYFRIGYDVGGENPVLITCLGRR